MSERGPVPESLRNLHAYGVAMPYSSNLGSDGKPRLSFYSVFVLHASSHLYREGHIEKIVLCGEMTFGRRERTTSDLMRDGLLCLGVAKQDIILAAETSALDNTPLQIKALSEFQKRNNLHDEQFLILAWDFHKKRIENHITGFGLNATVVTAEEVQKYFVPAFNLARLKEILPGEFEKGEKLLRALSKLDRRGFMPRMLSRVRGARVTDIKKVRGKSGELHLKLVDTTGKKRLKSELGEQGV